jgi:hypothetical protein
MLTTNQLWFVPDFHLKGAITPGPIALESYLIRARTFPTIFGEYHLFIDRLLDLNYISVSYQLNSLLFYGITPGLKEADHKSLQNFMRDWVDNLLMLYDDSIVIRTRKYPEGLSLLILGRLKYNHSLLGW